MTVSRSHWFNEDDFRMKHVPKLWTDMWDYASNPTYRSIQLAIKNGKLDRFMILCGPPGSGKTVTGYLCAASKTCGRCDADTRVHCGRCDDCLKVLTGKAGGVRGALIEIDSTSRTDDGAATALAEINAAFVTTMSYCPDTPQGRAGGYVVFIDEAHRAATGLWNGGFVYGYRSDPEERGKLIPDPEFATIIQQHFYDAVEKLGAIGAVTKRLRELGFNIPRQVARSGRTRGGKPFDKQQVKKILTNRIYLGEVRWGSVVTSKAHGALVAEEQFERVQRLLAGNRKTYTNPLEPKEYAFALKGLLRCGKCGAMLTPCSSTGRRGRHIYYACTTRSHKGPHACNAPFVPAKAIDEAIIKRCVELSGDEKARDQIISDTIKEADAEGGRLAHRLLTRDCKPT